MIDSCVSSRGCEVEIVTLSRKRFSRRADIVLRASTCSLEEDILLDLDLLFQIEAKIFCFAVGMRDMELVRE